MISPLLTLSASSALLGSVFASYGAAHWNKFRTVVTTDMEQDDLASLIRYLLYTNDLDNQGLIYSSSQYHWAGNGNGTSLRWTGTRTMQDIVIPAYAEVYENLQRHDPSYPHPEELLSQVKIGNIDFEGEMDCDTEGSNHIKRLLLDSDPRPLYLQAWGGTSTIARALRSIEEDYTGSRKWDRVQTAVSRKAVILASGFQDKTYANYISINWPQVRVEELSAGYSTWGYNCNSGDGNVRGLPDDHIYFTGKWTRRNIQMGPYGKLYRSWLDGQAMPGDPLDIFGDPEKAADGWCKPLGRYDFLSEGDNVAFNPLLTTGLQAPGNPNLGGWGGRSRRNSTSPDLWVTVDKEKGENGTEVVNYTTDRWIAAVQNDFAARMQWTETPKYTDGNHAPLVKIDNGKVARGHPGSTIRLTAFVHDPDGDPVATSWWQYSEEGTYPGKVTVTGHGHHQAAVKVPADAMRGQTISIILQGTDDGHFPLTRYDRLIIRVV